MPELTREHTVKVGTCNGCDRQIGEHGVAQDCVWMVQLKTTSFRLCDHCFSELLEKMKSRVENAQIRDMHKTEESVRRKIAKKLNAPYA